MAFANILRRKMKEKNLSQAELARRAHMTRDNVCTYVNARVYPRPDKIYWLAKALDCTVDDLTPKSAVLGPVGEEPAIDMRMGSGPGKVFLRISAELDMAKALRLLAILNEADGSNGEMRPA